MTEQHKYGDLTIRELISLAQTYLMREPVSYDPVVMVRVNGELTPLVHAPFHGTGEHRNAVECFYRPLPERGDEQPQPPPSKKDRAAWLRHVLSDGDAGRFYSLAQLDAMDKELKAPESDEPRT